MCERQLLFCVDRRNLSVSGQYVDVLLECLGVSTTYIDLADAEHVSEFVGSVGGPAMRQNGLRFHLRN